MGSVTDGPVQAGRPCPEGCLHGYAKAAAFSIGDGCCCSSQATLQHIKGVELRAQRQVWMQGRGPPKFDPQI